MALNRDQILAIQDCKVEEIQVPEWGGSVFIKVMSGTEREAWETKVVEKKLNGKIRTDLLVRSICDESGKCIFTADDIEALGKKNSVAIDRVFEQVNKLNRLTKKDLDDLGNVSLPTQ